MTLPTLEGHLTLSSHPEVFCVFQLRRPAVPDDALSRSRRVVQNTKDDDVEVCSPARATSVLPSRGLETAHCVSRWVIECGEMAM